MENSTLPEPLYDPLTGTCNNVMDTLDLTLVMDGRCVSLICLSYMSVLYALHVCLICVPICVPYMYAHARHDTENGRQRRLITGGCASPTYPRCHGTHGRGGGDWAQGARAAALLGKGTYFVELVLHRTRSPENALPREHILERTHVLENTVPREHIFQRTHFPENCIYVSLIRS